MNPFVSLNSWNEPGAILQAAEPEEIVAGGPEDWGKLREVLARRRKTGRDAVHPQSAAVGYITYEGAFHFAWFPKISVLRENGFSALWNERRAANLGGPGYLLPGRDRILSSAQEAISPAVTQTFASCRSAGPPRPGQQVARATPFIANQERENYEARVARAQDYISAGDIYQVNLAQKFSTAFEGNPYHLFEHLLARSPAPGGASSISATPRFSRHHPSSSSASGAATSPRVRSKARARAAAIRSATNSSPSSCSPIPRSWLSWS